MKKICFVTGTRAEFGLLSSLMKAVKEDSHLELQLLVTGMHLSPEFGLTHKEIENEGFTINEKVEMLLSSDTETGIVKSTGLGMIGFADSFNRLKPDLVVLLGDRFETFSAATAAYLLKIPIAHLHGGEVTEGATDEALRHAITKMAYLHFTSTDTYRKRVIQLGESPERVFNVGAIGIDTIKENAVLSKEELSKDLNIDFSQSIALITYHPVTLENNTAEEQFGNLIDVLQNFKDLTLIFTKANADANGRIINKMIDAFVIQNSNRYQCFTSLGSKRYLSLMKFASIVIGNSSSGIIEAPYFEVPTVNIGDRQKGREKDLSIIDSSIETKDILAAIRFGLSEEFRKKCALNKQVYGTGNTTIQILEILNENLSKQSFNLKKAFYDIP